MLPEKIRAAVKLRENCEAERFLQTLEVLLDRPLGPVRVLKRAGVLSLRLTEAELERVSALPEVLRAQPEGRAELPPKPIFSRR